MDCVECLGSFVVLLMCRDMGYENDIFDHNRCTAGGRTRIKRPLCETRARTLLHYVRQRTAHTEICFEPCNDITSQTWRELACVDTLTMNLRNVSAYVVLRVSKSRVRTTPKTIQVLLTIRSPRECEDLIVRNTNGNSSGL